MIITKTIYRYLVLISFCAFMIFLSFRNIFWEGLDDNTQRLLRVDGYGTTLPVLEYLFWIILTLILITYIGLIFFKRWGIILLIFLYIVDLWVFAPFGGIEISVPIEKIAKNMFIFCDGMIIALAFFSDLKIQFRWAEIERLEYLKRLVRFLNKEF